MAKVYNKPHLTYVEQRDLLQSRGLVISDRDKAADALARIGYYRLRPYWNALRDNTGSFRDGVEFRHAVELYVFDKRLRLIMLDAIERIEIALRVKLAHSIGKRDPLGHRVVGALDASRAALRHDDWLKRADESISRSKESWVGEHSSEFEGPLPIWMAVEIWDFGIVSRLLEMAHPNDRYAIAKSFGLLPDTLVSWIRCLVYVRNTCAHHSRLWNKPLVDQPKTPKQNWEARNVQHISADVSRRSRVYAAAAISRHLLLQINPNSSWCVRIKDQWQEFPDIPGLSPNNAGFFVGWETEPLWL